MAWKSVKVSVRAKCKLGLKAFAEKRKKVVIRIQLHAKILKDKNDTDYSYIAAITAPQP